MRILAPVNNPKEVEKIIQAGAQEIYCGIISPDWQERYTNVASPNRREWKTANLSGFNDLRKVVDVAHSNNTPVYLALNALYTAKQYPLLLKQIEQSREIGVDALIIADLGVLLTLKRERINIDIHISTGGTTFNSETAKFYEELGASRVILPRHLKVQEIGQIVRDCPSLNFEVFILNSGCKNIDGFCTFQHGISEILHGQVWNLPKRLNFDRHFLNAIRRLPMKITQRLKADIFGIDSACLLNYKVGIAEAPANINKEKQQSILRNASSYFNFLSGIDACGVCRLAEFKNMGVYGVKIVGRNYSTGKKVQDVKFLKTVLLAIENQSFEKEEFESYVKDTFRQIYRMGCGNLCYFPNDE